MNNLSAGTVECITSKQIAIRIQGRRTTIRLFDIEFKALNRICTLTGVTVDNFCTAAAQDKMRTEHSVTGKIRGAMFAYFLDGCGSNQSDSPSDPISNPRV